MTGTRWAQAALAMMIAAVAPAAAQALRIGMSAEPSSVDPHQYALTPNNTVRNHIYDSLITQDARLRVRPALATEWTRSDDRTWRFTLRQNVRFSNGDPFTAEDVLFSYCRTLNNENEVAASYSSDMRRLADVRVEGPHTLVIVTREPEPLLLADLASIAIIPRRLGPPGALRWDVEGKCGGGGPWPQLAQFNEGAASIGTGPYRLRAFRPGAAVELVRSDTYWGQRPHWAEVRLSFVTQGGPRLASLLANDQDVIEAPSTADLPRLRGDQALRVGIAPTTRLIFLQLDQREPAPFVREAAGNPLRDARVRQALSLAIDRTAIAERVMDGVALPASHVLPNGMRGTDANAPPLPFDMNRARALLAEAGFPNGFALTLHGTNNRYVNDARILQVVAQFWNRIGVRTEVDAIPAAVYFGRRARFEFSVPMGGWAANAEETLLFFRAWLLTIDRPRGNGTSNYSGWSNAGFDQLTLRAMATMDEEARTGLLHQAGRIVLEQMPVIPIHFESAVWASRRAFAYDGRSDQTTLAAEIRPQ